MLLTNGSAVNGPADRPSGADDRSARIDQLLEEVVRARRSGQAVSLSEVIRNHPDLEPELGERLRELERVEAAESVARSRTDVAGRSDGETEPVPAWLTAALPGYRLRGVLSRGGQATVYRATQVGTGRDVAVKVMRESVFLGGHDRSRFRREVRALGRLRHRNIVTIHDSGVADGCPYFVMEYIPGAPLDGYVRSKGLSVSECLRLFTKTCRAVHAAHLLGVIHRDLKPGNIRVDDEGEPHVLDFGLAKLIAGEGEEAAPSRQVTLTGQFVGSVTWASPEQAEGDSDLIDLRTDIYSLGVILYQMLTGRLPYDVNGSLHVVLDRIRRTEPARPGSMRPEVDEDVDAIVLKCLEKDPGRRYQSVAAVAEDIQRYLAHQPILARPPSTLYQLGKLVRRHRWPVALAVSISVLTAAFAVGMGISYRQASIALVRAVEAERLADERREAVQREARTTAAVRDFLVRDMLGSIRPERARGRKVEMEEVLGNAAARLDTAFPDQPQIEAAVRETLGDVYLSLGRFEAAEPQFRRAVAIWSNEHGPDCPEALTAQRKQASSLLRQRRLAEAETLTRETLQRCHASLGEDHTVCIDTAVQHSTALLENTKWIEAAELAAENYNRRRRLLGEDHPKTVSTLAAWLQANQVLRVDTPFMATQLRDVWQEFRASHGEDHPVTLSAMSRLGAALRNQRRFAEAEPLLRQAHGELNRVLGPDHPALIGAKLDMALLLLERGLVREAGEWNAGAVELARKRLGDDHPTTLSAMHDRVRVLFRRNRYHEAAAILERVVAGQRTALGEDHSRTTISLASLGYALLKLGRYAEARPLLLEAVELRRRIGAEDKADTWWILRQVVAVLAAVGEAETARPYAEELLEIQRTRADRPDANAHALNSYARELLTVVPVDLRDPTLALEFALLGEARSSDSYHYNRYTIALAYEANGELEKAIAYARRALQHSPIEYSSEREAYEAALVRMLDAAGDPVAAEDVYSDTLAARLEVFGPNHADVAAAQFNLGRLLTDHGNAAEAEGLLRESLLIRERLLRGGPDKPACGFLACETARTLVVLGRCLRAQDRMAEARTILEQAGDYYGPDGCCHPDDTAAWEAERGR